MTTTSDSRPARLVTPVLRELDQHVNGAVRAAGPWLTATGAVPEAGPDAPSRRREVLSAIGWPDGCGDAAAQERTVRWIAAAEVLLLALQVQLDIDQAGQQATRGSDRGLIDGDLLLARALTMAADLGGRELGLLAGMLDELALAAVAGPIVEGRRPAAGEMVSGELASRLTVTRATQLAAHSAAPSSDGLPVAATAGEAPAAPNRHPLVETLAIDTLGPDLARVEAVLVEMLDVPGRPEVTDALTYLVAAGGKRLRPLLVLLGSYAAQDGDLDAADGSAVAIAAAVEVLHIHTLYHDDVMDSASTRRGVPTAQHRWGEELAIGLGNVLCARAFEFASRIGGDHGRLMAASYQEICRGQSRELVKLFDLGRTEQDYLISIGGKTAFLLGAAARFGAMSTPGHDPALPDVLWDVAFNYGVAFQVIDDLLDILSHEVHLKKPAGTDMTEGVYTLPVLLAIREAPELRELLSAPPSAALVEEFRMRLAATDAVAASVRYAQDRCVAAKQILTEARAVHPEVRRALGTFDEIMFAPLVAAGVEVDR